MYHTVGTNGSIFPLGMPLICLFAMGAIKNIYSKRTETFLKTICIIILFAYYLTVFNPNRIINAIGLFATLGFYIFMFILAHLYYKKF